MSQTIINDVPPRTQASATGGQTVFGTNWTANYPSDVIVYSRASGVAADDLTQQVAYPSGYTVAFIGALQEVQVTLTTPSTLGDIVTITRMTPADRENLYTNTNFLPDMLNNDFGILTLVDQQAQLVNQNIAPRYNYSAIINPNLSFPTADTILPILAANQFWVKNNSNNEIIAADLPSSGIAPLNATYLTATNQVSILPNSFQLLAGTNVTLTLGINTLTVSVTGQAINPGTINDLAYYASSGSVLSPLSTGLNGILVTDGTGVPSISSTLPLGLTIPSPIIIGSNGFNVATFSDVALSTDYFNFSAGTVNAAFMQLISSQANASFSILAKGVGGVLVGSNSITSTVPFGMYNGTNKFEYSIPTWTSNRTITLRDLSGTLAYLSDIPSVSPSALTKTDDTNVTLTLGGSPSVSLLAATSLTLGWAGTLSASRGGLGLASPTAHGILVGEGSSAVNPIVLSSGQILIGSTGVDPVASAINSGTGILVGNGAGSITVSLASIATLNILSNITGGSAAPIANTLTATIDAAIGSTQGNVLYRSATGWTVLAPGTAGQFFTTGGAAANPSWSSQVAPTGAALTKTDDTNVTLTLGGTPSTALLQATSLTLGWTGQLSPSRGGTGISSLGTGVATALGINVGSAGAFVTFNGAGGTPSSMVGTNITGTAAGLTAGNASAVAVGGITGLGTGVATALAANTNGPAGSIPLITSGSWTPIDSSGASLSFTGVSGSYVRIGNVVIAVCGLTYPGTVSGSTAIIGGLPATSGTNQGGTVNYSTAATLSRILADSGSTTFHMYTAASAAITNANMSGSVNIFQIIYTV